MRFLAAVQTGPGAHLASWTIGTRSLFLEAKQPGCGIGHMTLSRTEVKEGVGLYLYSSSGPSWSVLG